MYRGDIDNRLAGSLGISLRSLFDLREEKGSLFKRAKTVLEYDRQVHQFLHRLAVRYNIYLLVEHPDLYQQIKTYVEEYHLPVSGVFLTPDVTHYQTLLFSTPLEAVLAIADSEDNVYSKGSTGEVMWYTDRTAGWSSLLDFMEGRLL